jgi:hypothetical protein
MVQENGSATKRHVSAIYPEPGLWIGGAPWQSINGATHADLARMREIVVRGRIGAFADVIVTREGLIAFDFANWQPAAALAVDHPSFDQLAEVQRNRTLFITPSSRFFIRTWLSTTTFRSIACSLLRHALSQWINSTRSRTWALEPLEKLASQP